MIDSKTVIRTALKVIDDTNRTIEGEFRRIMDISELKENILNLLSNIIIHNSLNIDKSSDDKYSYGYAYFKGALDQTRFLKEEIIELWSKFDENNHDR